MASTSRLSVLARSFSSSSVSRQLVKPPIQVFGIEGRYATALYSAASKQSSLDAVEKDLLKFQGLAKSDAKLADFLKDPSIKRRAKAEVFKAISSKLSLNPATGNLLVLLAENGRLGMMGQIVNAFKQIMAANRGEVICEVITAKPLDADTKGKLESTLKLFLQKGQTLLLTTKVNPAIIGGMLVSIGDKYVDLSISTKVKRYSDIIRSAA
ncbi:ATP synthase subunit O, mitochondrial [Diachasma alloeum]|uniref:Oligomycin sensitivity conferral protein n=1 Tax=Diachasma alloeum TaxID=454923 RepID=A0A4E0RZ48_9HYME|nr:ATP synthase subunit O, mitochondrial [Diachasma alloeum]THK33181.1 oligomycin sensitivity conferral protein, ATP synthase [Diachasma alloeum]